VLDCDERVDAALRDEIRTILANPGHEVYELPRRSTYCGQMIRHSGWWPDYVRRLFKRGAARFSDAMVHENLVTDRPIGRLKNPLTHFSFRSAEQVIAKMDRYSTDGAATAIAHGVAAFLRTYIFKLGFLDGRLGFVLAVSNAEGSYYRYVKAWLTVRDRDGYARADRDADDRP
jgi:hypothetical protein